MFFLASENQKFTITNHTGYPVFYSVFSVLIRVDQYTAFICSLRSFWKKNFYFYLLVLNH